MSFLCLIEPVKLVGDHTLISPLFGQQKLVKTETQCNQLPILQNDSVNNVRAATFSRIMLTSGFLNFLIGFDQLFKFHTTQRTLDEQTVSSISESNFSVFGYIIACKNKNGNIGVSRFDLLGEF